MKLTHLPLVALLVAGCNFYEEATFYSYLVVNYSPNTYIVQVTDTTGVVSAIAVSPESRIAHPLNSRPTQAVVYEQDCSHKVATVEPIPMNNYIFIDKFGKVSTPVTMSNFEANAVPYQDILPLPALCP